MVVLGRSQRLQQHVVPGVCLLEIADLALEVFDLELDLRPGLADYLGCEH